MHTCLLCGAHIRKPVEEISIMVVKMAMENFRTRQEVIHILRGAVEVIAISVEA